MAAEFDEVVIEGPLTIAAAGGETVATIMRTPGHDLELVRGLVFAEGVPGDPAVSHGGDDRVVVAAPASAFTPRRLVAGAGCGVCGREFIADLAERAEVVASRLRASAAMIASLPMKMRPFQETFATTGGIHAAALFDAQGELLVLREDVGRHNAVDKLVGWGRAHGVDFGVTVLMLSGRLGFELSHKAVMAGIPIVAAVSAPSTLAIDIAERFGVALCGFVRDGRLNVYSHAKRINFQ